MSFPRLATPSVRLFALAVLLALGIGALFARAIWTMRDEQWSFAERNGANLASALEDSVGVTLRSFDRSLEGLVKTLQNPEAMALPDPLRQRVLFDESLRMSGNGGVVVLNAQGDIVMDYGNAVPRKANLADREYFKVFAKGERTGLYVGAPILGRLSGKYGLPFSRAWVDAQGRFAGVVVGTIRIEYFNDLFARLNLGSGSSITLLRDDGVIVTRFPASDERVGKTLAGTSNLLILQGRSEGASVSKAVSDGVTRLYTFRHVDGFPLILNVGQQVDQVTSRWARGAWVMSGFAALLMLACIGLATLFTRELRRRQRVSAQLASAERDMRTVLDNAPSVIGYWDADQRNRFANGAYLPYFGMAPDMVRGMFMQEVLGASLYEQCRAFVSRALEGKRQWHECSLNDADGALHHVMASWVPDREGTEVRGVFMQLTDITDRKMMEDELFEDKERMRLTLQSIGDAVICTDARGRITYLNPMAERMTGWQAFDAASRDVDEVCPFLHVSDEMQEGREEAVAIEGEPTPIRKALAQEATEGPMRGVVVHRIDGPRFDVDETASAITDRHGSVTGAVMVLRDVTANVALAQRMQRLAQYDPLTDLPNRLLLQDRAALALAQSRRVGMAVGVVFLDLDGFKQVNDRLGHEAGDLLLMQFARRLQAATRATDTVSRKGGDEFVVLLTGIASADQLAPLARKLLAVCALPFALGAEQVAVGLSGGVALHPQHSDSFEALERQADSAMYEAKRAGRGRVHLFDEDGASTSLTEVEA